MNNLFEKTKITDAVKDATLKWLDDLDDVDRQKSWSVLTLRADGRAEFLWDGIYGTPGKHPPVVYSKREDAEQRCKDYMQFKKNMLESGRENHMMAWEDGYYPIKDTISAIPMPLPAND